MLRVRRGVVPLASVDRDTRPAGSHCEPESAQPGGRFGLTGGAKLREIAVGLQEGLLHQVGGINVDS